MASAPNLSIQKTNIEWRVVNNQFSALDKFQELWPNISDLRFVSQKLGADAMNLLGPLINITLWVNVFMELSTTVAAERGHRIIELGGVELVDRRYSGRQFHKYINPERDIDEGAQEVHGISAEFLADKPKIADVWPQFLEFIQGAELIIHNAPFDIGFLNA